MTSQENSVVLGVRYDQSRNPPYCCRSPKDLEVEAIGFESFFWQLSGRLSVRGKMGRHHLPPQEQTGLVDVEYKSLEIALEMHNERL